MTDTKYEIVDLITNALEQKPAEFETSFASLLKDRLRGAVEAKKQEVASSMFMTAEEDEIVDHEPEETEEDETSQDYS